MKKKTLKKICKEKWKMVHLDEHSYSKVAEAVKEEKLDIVQR